MLFRTKTLFSIMMFGVLKYCYKESSEKSEKGQEKEFF